MSDAEPETRKRKPRAKREQPPLTPMLAIERSTSRLTCDVPMKLHNQLKCVTRWRQKNEDLNFSFRELILGYLRDGLARDLKRVGLTENDLPEEMVWLKPGRRLKAVQET